MLGSGSGTLLIKLGVLRLAEHCHTQVFLRLYQNEDDLRKEADLKKEDYLKNDGL